MKVINKSNVKKIFNKEGIQCPIDSLNQIEEILTRQVITMARRCKEGNLKRLTPELMWIALGNLNNR
tara:strand:- start:655 stop:855 length:201 start_codon:yes stop_codon:yes gene_type:complete